MFDLLHQAISTANDRLGERLELADTAMAERVGRNEIVQKTDAFLVNACRHTAVMCDVLLPEARRHLPDGQSRVHAYVQQCRRTERAFVLAKQRLYGEAHAVTAPWSDVWSSAVHEFRALKTVEGSLLADLAQVTAIDFHEIASGIESATGRAPTRPHPNSPHTGPLSHVLRGMWARADRFWDTAEGRIVTDPRAVKPLEDIAA